MKAVKLVPAVYDGQNLWKGRVLSMEWKSEGVTDSLNTAARMKMEQSDA